MNLIQKHWRWLGLLLLIGILFFIVDRVGRTGLLFGNRPIIINNIEAPPLPTPDAAQIARGETLYAQHCASCHGAKLEGAANWKEPNADGVLPPPPHDNSGHTWHHKDELLINNILNGGDLKYNSKMPAFKDKLSETDAIAILEFIKSTWGQKEREFQWWVTTVSDQQ